jgi:hypothetical protein
MERSNQYAVFTAGFAFFLAVFFHVLIVGIDIISWGGVSSPDDPILFGVTPFIFLLYTTPFLGALLGKILGQWEEKHPRFRENRLPSRIAAILGTFLIIGVISYAFTNL